MKKRKTKLTRGVSLIEIVLAVSILSFSLFGLLSIFGDTYFFGKISTKNIQAAFLLEEGAESLRVIRDTSWTDIDSLVVGNKYSLSFEENSWHATTSVVLIDNFFNRYFYVEDVYRNNSNDRVTEDLINRYLDPNTKKFVVFTSWSNGKSTTTKDISFYLTNFLSY